MRHKIGDEIRRSQKYVKRRHPIERLDQKEVGIIISMTHENTICNFPSSGNQPRYIKDCDLKLVRRPK